jgi:transcriptional regulator with XRE-family HTH domain
MKIFAERLKELRSEKGLSAMALGKAIGLSDAAIIRWENNQRDIKAENLVEVAKFFGVSADYLLGLED